MSTLRFLPHLVLITLLFIRCEEEMMEVNEEMKVANFEEAIEEIETLEKESDELDSIFLLVELEASINPEVVEIISSEPESKVSENVEERNHVSEHKEVRIRTVVSQEIIDSLNSIVDDYNPQMFHQVTVQYFTDLSSFFRGKTYFIEDAHQVSSTVLEILDSRLNEATDLVLLVDKTGSMEDDRRDLEKGMIMIKQFLEQFSDVRVGIASYGDKNWHGDLWYTSEQLTDDLDLISRFVEEYDVMGNPDTRESVNDAIVETIDHMNWEEGRNKLILVIGDAPSQRGELTDYSSKEVARYCVENDVVCNVYPIILSNKTFDPDEVKEVVSGFAKVYPNPADNVLKFSFDTSRMYFVTCYDMNGRKVLTRNLGDGMKAELDVSSLENGQYLIQVHDVSMDFYKSEKITILHN